MVEHDEDIMKSADMIIDIGPEAGTLGGHLVAQGTYYEILKSTSLTAKYLNGDLEITVPRNKRSPRKQSTKYRCYLSFGCFNGDYRSFRKRKKYTCQENPFSSDAKKTGKRG